MKTKQVKKITNKTIRVALVISLIGITGFASFPLTPVWAEEATQAAVLSAEASQTPTPTVSPSPFPSISLSPTLEPTVTSLPNPENTLDPIITPPSEKTTEEKGLDSLLDLEESGRSAVFRGKKSIRISKKTFKSTEKVVVTLTNSSYSEIKKTEVVDSSGEEVSMITKIEADENSVYVSVIPGNHLTPGEYTIEIQDKNGETYTQDFTWGVLALNTNKSVYIPGEDMVYSMAVLDSAGEMVCDAKVSLVISGSGYEETMSTENKKIVVNPECFSKSFTLKNDYEAFGKAPGVGSYKLTLTAETKNGSFTITDEISVVEKRDFDIERSSLTRLYPINSYPMEITVTAEKDFEGIVTEQVPADFQISELEGAQKFVGTKIESTQTSVGQDVLGAKTSLPLPFKGNHGVTLGFGEQLQDPDLINKYQKYGLLGHDGVDFEMPTGTDVISVDDGKVLLADEDQDYGTTIVIEHEWGRSYYGHLSELNVEAGDRVEKGDVIALSGDTGLSTAPHLHFGVKPKNFTSTNGYFGKVDPSPLLNLPDHGLTQQEVLGIQDDVVKVITWSVKLKKGESTKLGYQFKAPEISPQFYVVGPARVFNTDNQLVFKDGREWQLAVDAPSNVVNSFYLRSTTANTAFGTAGPTTKVSSRTDNVSGSPTSKTTALAMTTDEGTSVSSVGGTETATSNPTYIWFRTFVSPKLAAQTIQSGTQFRLEMGFGESAVGMNAFLQQTIYVWRQGTGNVATLYDGAGLDQNCGLEPDGATGVARNQVCLSTNVVSANTPIQDGDQLALELWVRAENTSSTSFTATMYFEGTDFIGQGVANDTATISSSMSRLTVSQNLILQSETNNNTSWYLGTTSSSAAFGTTGPTTKLGAGTDSNSAIPTNKTTALAMDNGQGSPTTTVSATETSTSAQNLWFRTFLSPRLAGQTLTAGTVFRFEGANGESAAGANVTFRIHVFQWRQGTGLVTSFFDGSNGTACGLEPDGVVNTPRNNTCLTTATGADVTLQDGDQIGLEVWMNYNNTSGTSFTGSMYFNGNSLIEQGVANDTVSVSNAASSLSVNRTLTYLSSTYTQNEYEWFSNADNVQPGSSLASENTAAVLSNSSTVGRLRMNLTVATEDLAASSDQFKLQYSTSTSGPWSDVGAYNDWCDNASCDENFTERKKMTFNNAASSSNLTNFPVLVMLNASNFDYSKTQADGDDIRFTDSDGTELDYEIEVWDEAATSYVWVKVPQIDSGSTTDYMWMYFNNAGASSGADPTAVWSSSYSGVWHLSEDPSGSAPQMLDSTSNNNDGTTSGMSSGYGTASKDYKGLFFDSSATVNMGNGSSLDNTTNTMTAEMWYRRSAIASTGNIFERGVNGSNGYTFGVGITSCTANQIKASKYGVVDVCVGLVPPDTTWHHLTVVWNGSGVVAYTDGVQMGATSTDTANFITSSADFGMSTGSALAGTVDELRISSAARSADWIMANYLSVSNNYITLGDEESYTEKWKFYNNAGVSDGATLSSALLTATDALESYQEGNPSVLNPNSATTTQDIEYDFALDPANADTDTAYYFRMVKANGTVLGTYTRYPEVEVSSVNVPSAPTLYGVGSGTQVAFSNIKQNSSTPTVRASATYDTTFDRFQVEFNTASDFSGTAYTQTFSSTYSSATEYDLLANSLSPSLPTTNGVTYYIRARASGDSGSNYGNWSSGVWSFTYSSSGNPQWFQTTDDQFDTGTLVDTQTSGSNSVELAGGAPSSYAFDQEVSGSYDAVRSKTLTFTNPPAENSFIIILARLQDVTNATFTWPAGFTELWNTNLDGANAAAYKVAGSSEGSGYTVTWNQDSFGQGWYAAEITGVNPSSPIDVSPIVNDEGFVSSYTTAGLTTTVDNALHIIGYQSREVGTTPPTGYAEEVDGNQIWLADKAISTAGGTGTFTINKSIWDTISFEFALKPASSLASSGTIMSPEVDYDSYEGASSWGEFSWGEDLTDGDIEVQVYYTSSTACDTIVPDGALSGNSSGFTTSPVDISGLNTTTYNRICLFATLTDSGGTPYLTDWTVTWEAGSETPTLAQLMKHGLWFNSSGVKQPFYW